MAQEGDKKKQYLGAVAACMFALCAGTTLGWASPAARIQCGDAGYNVTKEEWSWVASILPLGAVLSALPAGAAVQALGRKRLMLLLTPVMLIGWACIVAANASWILLLGRFICGATIGSFCIIAPMFTAEISEDSVRGTLGSYFQFLLTCGVMFVYIVGLITKNPVVVSGVCMIWPVLGAIAFFFFPDTPHWYLSKGREAEARESLKFYRGPKYNVEQELETIKAVLKEERERAVPFSEAISTTAAKKGLMLSLALMVFQQLSGINAIIFYASDLFKGAGSEFPAGVPEVIVGVCLAGATFASTFLVGVFGRRTLLLLSGGVCAVCSAALGTYMHILGHSSSQTDICTDLGDGVSKPTVPPALQGLEWIPIAAMAVYMVIFSFGYGPIPWLYMSEVFSPQIKGVGMAIANMSNWATVFIVTKFYGNLSDAVGPDITFFIFASILVLGCVFSATMLLETKDKSKEQILQELSGEKSSSNVA